MTEHNFNSEVEQIVTCGCEQSSFVTPKGRWCKTVGTSSSMRIRYCQRCEKWFGVDGDGVPIITTFKDMLCDQLE